MERSNVAYVPINPMKMAKCITELERIYGIQKGNNQNSLQDNLTSKTQTDLANQINITDEQLRNYKKLNNLIPELQTMVENEAIKAMTRKNYRVLFYQSISVMLIIHIRQNVRYE